MSNTPIELRPYTVKELAEIYGINFRTMSKWIAPFSEEIGKKNGRYYNIAQVQIIREKLGGFPRRINDEL